MVNYNYDAWGNTTYEVNSSYEFSLHSGMIYTAETIRKFNSFTYRSYYYDKDVKLYYLINRYYDSTTGRFISIDDTKYLDFEVLFGYNRYAYCCNNPIMGYDPLGTWGLFFWSTVISSVVGLISNVVTTVVEAKLNNEEITTEKIFKAAVVGAVTGATTTVTTLLTGNSAVGNYAGAAAGSITEEIWEYAAGEKELTSENVLSSVEEVAADTIVDGTMSVITDMLIDDIPGLKYDQCDVVPKTTKEFFTSSYGKKTIEKLFLGGVVGVGLSVVKDGLLLGIEEHLVQCYE